jgi:predicted amino acid-binding ACT domain protein
MIEDSGRIGRPDFVPSNEATAYTVMREDRPGVRIGVPHSINETTCNLAGIEVTVADRPIDPTAVTVQNRAERIDTTLKVVKHARATNHQSLAFLVEIDASDEASF